MQSRPGSTRLSLTSSSSPETSSTVVAFYGKSDIIISQVIKDDADRKAAKAVISQITGKRKIHRHRQRPGRRQGGDRGKGKRRAAEIRPAPDGRDPGSPALEQVLVTQRGLQPRVPRQHEDDHAEGVEGHDPGNRDRDGGKGPGPGAARLVFRGVDKAHAGGNQQEGGNPFRHAPRRRSDDAGPDQRRRKQPRGLHAEAVRAHRRCSDHGERRQRPGGKPFLDGAARGARDHRGEERRLDPGDHPAPIPGRPWSRDRLPGPSPSGSARRTASPRRSFL